MKLQFDSPIVTLNALNKYFQSRSERVMLEPSHPAYANQKAIDLGKFQRVYRQAHKESSRIENSVRLSPDLQSHRLEVPITHKTSVGRDT